MGWGYQNKNTIKYIKYTFENYKAYGLETRHVKCRIITKLNTTDIHFWWRSVRISRKDKIRNTPIKEREREREKAREREKVMGSLV